MLTSPRIIIRLGLGLLCGLALVLIPAVFSTGTSIPAPSSWSNLSGQTFQPQNRALPFYGLNNPGASAASFLAIILFIFLPSTVFSLLVRRWAEKKAHDYLE